MDVLVIEDEAVLGKALQRGLSDSRYSCTWVRNGRKGLDLGLTQRFDAIVLDLLLPDMDGIQVIRDWIEAPGYEDSNAEMRRHVFEDPELVDVPVTIAWGELDRLVRPPRSERRPPGSRFIVLPGCGHTPNWDDPELITQLLLEASDPAVVQTRAA